MFRRLALAAALCLLTMTLAQAHVPETTTFPLLPDPVINVEPLTTPPLLTADGLSPRVAERALDALSCASSPGQSIDKLIVVDMNMSSRRKRLWAFDLKGEPKLILNARVAHGSGSDPDGDGIANRFSNVPNSNMTSLGLYRIAEAYEGKNGLSRRASGPLQLQGPRARRGHAPIQLCSPRSCRPQPGVPGRGPGHDGCPGAGGLVQRRALDRRPRSRTGCDGGRVRATQAPACQARCHERGRGRGSVAAGVPRVYLAPGAVVGPDRCGGPRAALGCMTPGAGTDLRKREKRLDVGVWIPANTSSACWPPFPGCNIARRSSNGCTSSWAIASWTCTRPRSWLPPTVP